MMLCIMIKIFNILIFVIYYDYSINIFMLFARNLIWFYLLGIFATYSSVMAPLTCAFNAEEYLPYQIIIVMEFAFIVDILRGWICAYHDNQPIANDRFLHWYVSLAEAFLHFDQYFLYS